MDKFHLLAEQAALLVELIDIELQGLEFRIAQEGGGAGDGEEGSDLDGLRRLGGGSQDQQAGAGDGREYVPEFHVL